MKTPFFMSMCRNENWHLVYDILEELFYKYQKGEIYEK